MIIFDTTVSICCLSTNSRERMAPSQVPPGNDGWHHVNQVDLRPTVRFYFVDFPCNEAFPGVNNMDKMMSSFSSSFCTLE